MGFFTIGGFILAYMAAKEFQNAPPVTEIEEVPEEKVSRVRVVAASDDIPVDIDLDARALSVTGAIELIADTQESGEILAVSAFPTGLQFILDDAVHLEKQISESTSLQIFSVQKNENTYLLLMGEGEYTAPEEYSRMSIFEDSVTRVESVPEDQMLILHGEIVLLQ